MITKIGLRKLQLKMTKLPLLQKERLNTTTKIYEKLNPYSYFSQDIINRFSSVTIDNKNGKFIFKK